MLGASPFLDPRKRLTTGMVAAKNMGLFNNWSQFMSSKQPAEKPGPHHDHKGHTPGDLDEHGHRDTSVPGKKQTQEHHDHAGHTPGDKDQHGHQDTGSKKK